MFRFHPISTALFSALLFLLTGAPSSADKPAFEIQKVLYSLIDGSRLFSESPMINFERKHRLHGAITAEEFQARYGHYYTVFWKARSTADVQVRLEYQQALTGLEIKEKIVSYEQAAGREKTEFTVIGDEFKNGGRVLAWRISLLVDGQLQASEQSFLWK